MTGQTSKASGVIVSARLVRLSGPQLSNALEHRLIGKEWRAGTRLPSEREFAEEYAVSRPVVREALRALQERGWIDVFAGRGSFVRELRLTADWVDPLLLVGRVDVSANHLVVARTMLETKAAELAADRRTWDDVTAMRRILARFETTDNIAEAAHLDLAFHEAIAMASQNPVIQMMFGSIRKLTHGIVLRSLSDREVRGTAVPLHGVILDAIAAQDPPGAAAAMSSHISAAERYYGEDLDAPLADVLTRRASQIPDLSELLSEVSRSISAPSDAMFGSSDKPNQNKEGAAR